MRTGFDSPHTYYMIEQLNIFNDDQLRPDVKRLKRTGGSANPIVFRDYESFISKLMDNPKTTDECWTPEDVYQCVVDYVGSVYDMTGKVILRPFYPGGDYEHAEYPENGVVIDNPPFSIFTKIVAFYTARRIPFFLFGPGMTIGSVFKYCTAVFINTGIEFSNKAVIRLNFATNLMGDLVAVTAPELNDAIKRCKSQNQKVSLPLYVYPEELLSVSDMQIIAGGGQHFQVSREECEICRDLDKHPKSLFGEHLLISAAKAAAKAAVHVPLSRREQLIVDRLK